MTDKGKKKSALARVTPEGDRTSLHRLSDPIRVGADGSILIESAGLETPANVYDADFAWVERRFEAISIFFAKADRDTAEKLRSRLEIRYPLEAFYRHFWKNSREFHDSLKKNQGIPPNDPLREGLNPEKWPSTKDHSEWVNFDVISRTGSQACFDFFHLSPSGIARFAKGQGTAGLTVAPIVRVLTTTNELYRLMNVSQSVVEQAQELLARTEGYHE